MSESINFISNIEIFSDKNLTSSILSNQNLKDYFIIKFHSLNSVNSFLLSNEFEKKFNEVYKILFLSFKINSFDFSRLNNTYHKFTIKLYFSDNTIETFSFNKVYLTN